MKPPSFEYRQAASAGAAVELLTRYGGDAKVLAGGQSLIPVLNFRLVRPAALIDINTATELDYITSAEGVIRIGALTRQATAERSALLAGELPLLPMALRHVAHYQIRNRGTVGGSLAHADPAAELPTAAAALDACFTVLSSQGKRSVAWSDFFQGPFQTALAPDELLVEVEIPLRQRRTGYAYLEHTRRHGDFALAGTAISLTLADGACERATIALLGAEATPVRATAAERLLSGADFSDALAAEAAAVAVADTSPTDDLHASASQKRALLEHLVHRGLHEAAQKTDECR